MKIFPAIDLYGGKAVRLFKGDYAQMTVYNDDPIAVARDFKAQGAEYIHVVDLEGAKTGIPAHVDTVKRIVQETGLFVEIGGGIRAMQTVDVYLSAGASRVILGTAAVTDEAFLRAALEKYGEKIAVAKLCHFPSCLQSVGLQTAYLPFPAGSTHVQDGELLYFY